MKTDIALLLFARAPQLGAVKTRLANDIGASNALSLHIAFVNDCLNLLANFSQTRRSIYLTSSWQIETAPLPTTIEQGIIDIQFQSDGNLGTRMENAMRANFNNGCCSVIIIGSDSPNLPADYLQEAITALQDNDCVIGRSEDGGYYLIGARAEIADRLSMLFEDINWSTETVFSETIARIEIANWRVHQLPQWYDIDTLADLIRLKHDLSDRSSQVFQVLQQIKI